MRKVLKVLSCLVLVVALLVLPYAPVYATDYNAVEGSYALKLRYNVKYLDLTSGDKYTEGTLVITDMTSGVLTGYVGLTDLIGLATGKLVKGTGRFTGAPMYLDRGATTVTCTRAGTCVITLPTGVTGTAASGTATVTGSPVTLNAATATTVTTTTTGTITVTLVGAKLVSGTGVFTGSPISLDGSDTVTCTSTGTCIISLPAGVTGVATSSTGGVVTGSPKSLIPGDNTVTVTVTGSGIFNVTLYDYTVVAGFIGGGTGNTRFVLYTNSFSGLNLFAEGRVRMDGSTVVSLTGKMNAYLIPRSGEVQLIQGTFSGPWTALD